MISQLVDGNRMAKAVQLFRHRYIPLVSANRKRAPFAAIAQNSRRRASVQKRVRSGSS
jgi:hypothetical protein